MAPDASTYVELCLSDVRFQMMAVLTKSVSGADASDAGVVGIVHGLAQLI